MRLFVALIALGCAPELEQTHNQEGYGGAVEETSFGGSSSVESSAATTATGGSSRRNQVSWAPITGGATASSIVTAATGGTSSVTQTATGGVTSVKSTATGGSSYTSTTATGGAPIVASSFGGSATGGTTSASTTKAVETCFWDVNRPQDGYCAEYSKGRSSCNANGECVGNKNLMLDCDRDGVAETSSFTNENCGYCGNVCSGPFECTMVEPNYYRQCK
jgi:hypothetical protein